MEGDEVVDDAAPEESTDEVVETSDVSPEEVEVMMDMIGQKPAAPADEPAAVEPAEPAEPVEPATAKPADAEKPAASAPKATEPQETELQASLRREGELRQLLNEMASGRVTPQAPAAASPAPASASSPAAAVPASPAPAGASVDTYGGLNKILSPENLTKFAEKLKEEIPFMTKEELDSVIDKPELILKSLNSVRRRTVEDMMGVLPMLVAEQITSVMATQRAVEEFYQANSDLNAYRGFTQHTYEKVYAANHDKPMADILKLTAETVRKELRLATPAAMMAADKAKPAKPKFPAEKGSGTRKPAAPNNDKKKSQQDFMIETL